MNAPVSTSYGSVWQKAAITTIATMLLAGLSEELVNALSGSVGDDKADPGKNSPGNDATITIAGELT
jgi:hypothetical protein